MHLGWMFIAWVATMLFFVFVACVLVVVWCFWPSSAEARGKVAIGTMLGLFVASLPLYALWA